MPDYAVLATQIAGRDIPGSYIVALLIVLLASLSAVAVGVLVKRRMDRIAPPQEQPSEADQAPGQHEGLE